MRPLVRVTCDATLSIPLAPGVESLNVSVAAAVTLFEARRQRIHQPRLEVEGLPDVALYLFDGSNLFHAGRFADRDELVDELASFVAVRGARGVVVFDGVGRGQGDRRRSRVRFAPTPTRCSSGSPPRRRDARGGAPRHVRCRSPGNERSGGAEARLRGVPRGARRRVSPRGRAEPARRPRRPGDPCAPRAASPR